ncbi:cytochrome P450 [Streptomyces sp. NPDC088554]|uniref:cytochrome P450 n=1 Tax=Streptomyces sp. NPDC088554 TaxID=3365865 RepID=UPI003821FBAF
MTTYPALPLPRTLLDPAPEYARWRAEEPERPLRRVILPDGSTPWLVTRRADARSVLADPRFSADASRPGFPGGRKYTQQPRPGLFHLMDPPDHTRLRRMLIPEFSFRRTEALRGRLQRICDDLIDAMVAAATAGGVAETDLVAAYALPLPTLAICELLGVADQDRAFYRAKYEVVTDLTAAPEEVAAARTAVYAHLRALLSRRVHEPADDLVSRLAMDRIATGEVTLDEATGMLSLLLVAGHETTANLIGLSVAALLRSPAQLAALRAGVDGAGWPNAVEELLRHLTEVRPGLCRIATEDVQVAGVLVRAGEGVVVAVHAANRDPVAIPAANRDQAAIPAANRDPVAIPAASTDADGLGDLEDLDITRNVGRHLAFGHGPHQCIGQSLARIELETALSTLFHRLPGLRATVPTEGLALSTSAVHGLRTLPVTW